MIFEWESREEKLKWYMKIPPEQKLQWLEDMRKFMLLASTEKDIELRWKLRERR